MDFTNVFSTSVDWRRKEKPRCYGGVKKRENM